MTMDNEHWSTLSGPNVTLAQRWISAWADLLMADMALLERSELDDQVPSTVFHRRALWESAVVSYGRCAVSDHRRNIPFRDFVREVSGDSGLEVHETIMDWRHGHVAHRKRPEFEGVETVLAFDQDERQSAALRMILDIAHGPVNDADLVKRFQTHVETIRDAMFERKVKPLAVAIVDDLNKRQGTASSDLRRAIDRSSSERYVINHLLLKLEMGKSEPSA